MRSSPNYYRGESKRNSMRRSGMRGETQQHSRRSDARGGGNNPAITTGKTTPRSRAAVFTQRVNIRLVQLLQSFARIHGERRDLRLYASTSFQRQDLAVPQLIPATALL
jgi:hypothetical protein